MSFIHLLSPVYAAVHLTKTNKILDDPGIEDVLRDFCKGAAQELTQKWTGNSSIGWYLSGSEARLL